MPFYTQEASSSTSFHTARRSTPDNGSRTSLVISMVDPFVRLRPRSTRKSNEDDWYIPYTKPVPPSSHVGIGASPHAPPPKQSSLMSYLHAPLPNAPNDAVRTYRFPSTFPARSFPQRPLPTQLQPPDSAPSHSDSGMRVPTTSSVPTGLTAPKLLFSPLARDARQPPPDPPEQPVSAEVRARTLSAPARANRHRHVDDSKRWVTPTVCDRFVFPRPALTPHVITPPSSPERVGSDDRSSFLSKAEWREEGKKRLQEREDWADYVQRRGRSMSFGDQKSKPGAPIIGNARIRTREHERRTSRDGGNGRRNSLSSLFHRGSSDRRNLHPSASDDNVGAFNSFGFARRMSSRATPSHPDDSLVTPSAAGEDFFPSRYPSHRYGGIRGLRGHTHTRSSPDLSQVSREASMSDAPPLPPGPPPRTLRIQHRGAPYRGQEDGVVVIGPGGSGYRAPPPEPRRPTDLDASSSARSPRASTATFRSRAPRPLDLTVTVSNGYASAPATGTLSSQRSSGANIHKALPDVPRADNSPTLELAPFSDLSTEVGMAMSPEMRSISGMATIRGSPRPPRRNEAYDSTLMYFNSSTPFRKSDVSSVGTSPFRKSDTSSIPTRDSALSPARALLVKQHQLAKTKRAFQSPATRQPSTRSTKTLTDTPLWRQDSVATPSSAPYSNASFSSSRPLISEPNSASSATAMPPTAFRRPTALEEAIGRSRAASLSTLEQQDPLAKSSSNRTLHKAGGSDGSHAPPYSTDQPADSSFVSFESSATPIRQMPGKSPVLGRPITTPSSVITPTPARYGDAPFLPLPTNPPNMLRTDTSTTTQSKTTAYSSASEGWGRGIESGTTTPVAGVRPGASAAGEISGDHVEHLDQGTPRDPMWTDDVTRTPQNPRNESPDETPSPVHMDDRDFAGLFFRTPKDLDGFSSPGTMNAVSPGTLAGASRDSSGLQPADDFSRENTGLGIGLPNGPPLENLAIPLFTEERRTSDASNGTNGTGGTGDTGATGATGGTGQTGGSGHTQIDTPPLGELIDIGGSSQESYSGPSAESASRLEDRDATLRARPKARLVESDASVSMMFSPSRPPLSSEIPEPGTRGSPSPEPTPAVTPSSSQRNLPSTRTTPFSPGTFGHPTPGREREEYFGHRSNPSSQSALSSKSARSAQSGLSTQTGRSEQSIPIRPPRPPSPGLEAFRQSTDLGPIITFARTGDTISPVHSPRRSAESYDKGRYSAVPSFVSDFPSPPLPDSPTITQFSTAEPSDPSSSSSRTLSAGPGTGSNETVLATDTSAPPVPPLTPAPTLPPVAQVDEFGNLPSSPKTPGSSPRQVMSGAISSPSSPSRKARRHGMAFGQVVTGSPGAGKSTYVHGMQQFLSALQRPCHIINLDPATPNPSYPCAINITDLVSLDDVMREHRLGPNGAMLYCAEYLEANMDWLMDRLDRLLYGDTGETQDVPGLEREEAVPGYVIFDTPGQVELWTNHDSFKHVLESLTKLEYRLVSVHLSDAHHITDASTFISVALLALRANMQLELPHINVLSKIDRLATYGELPFDLRYYTECRDLEYLLSSLDWDSRQTRMSGLNKAMVELVEQYGAASFETLAVEDKRSMLKLVRVLDNALGYIPLSRSLPGDVGAGDMEMVQGEAELLGSMPTLEELGDVDDVQERWGWRKEEADKEDEEAWGREWEMRKARDPHLHTDAHDLEEHPADDAEQEDEDDDDNTVFRAAERALPLSGMAAQVLRPQPQL